jgi:myo-inositol-1(or 4)-monophosphatase
MEYLDIALEAAAEAGELLLREGSSYRAGGVEFKSAKDLVTASDRRAEELIVSIIRRNFPKHAILGEETGASGTNGEFTWIIDPIDGTTSFVHDQPFYAVSIALRKNDEPIAAVVHAPRLGETFAAEKGAGASLNGEKIKVSNAENLISSVLATGFACLRADLAENNLKHFNQIAPKIRGIRRYGSAAIDMAYVAAGRLDGFWELNLKPYDIAAGHLLVLEAGGEVRDFRGGTDFPENGTIATNGKITTELLNELAMN